MKKYYGICVLITLFLVIGCHPNKRRYKHPSFVSESDAARYLDTALESPNPDERRECIVQIARTSYVDDPVARQAMRTLVLDDPSTLVRSTSMRILAEVADPQTVPLAIQVLAKPDDEGKQLPPVGTALRRDATRALAAMTGSEQADMEQFGQQIQETAIRLINADRNRDVRMASAEILGWCPSKESLDTLIHALEQRDFGISHECERSLMRLTGHTFNHNAIAWNEWLAETEDPFADAGQLDEALERKEKGWWQRTAEIAKRNLSNFAPKED